MTRKPKPLMLPRCGHSGASAGVNTCGNRVADIRLVSDNPDDLLKLHAWIGEAIKWIEEGDKR
jgi:hypothetical protein